MKLKDKVAIVTGGAMGNGLGIVIDGGSIMPETSGVSVTE